LCSPPPCCCSASPWSGALLIGLFVAQGCFGRDLVRWSIALRGFASGPIIAARDHDAAYARLITERPDLFPSLGEIVS
jgi:hypothetical protein